MKKLLNKLKKEFKKLKYLDKTKKQYFAVMVFLLTFCLFTSTTYSYFYLTKNLNAATLAIGRLRYSLSSTTEGYNDGSITVEAGETKTIDLTLHSYNKEETKYALIYSANPNVKVYYSENLKNNMSGIISSNGSEITLRIVIVNNATSAETVNLAVSGGYLQNTLTSNITEGYYESDITVRAILLDENLQNGIIATEFPAKTSEYGYYQTKCTNNATATWDSTNWQLTLNDIEQRNSCDVYFKKMQNDIEIYYQVKNADGTLTNVEAVPNDGTYEFASATCNGGISSWNNDTWSLQIDGLDSKTICTATFTKK